jgi:hypothetical protein
MKYLPEFKFTPFDEALKESVDWFVQVSSMVSSTINYKLSELRADLLFVPAELRFG